MNVIKSNPNFIKYGSYVYDESCRVIGVPSEKSGGPVIKAHQTALSYAEKYRLGILTYPEYLMWQAQISLGLASATVETVEEPKEAKNSDSAGRFWENDSGSRQNVSESDYEQFLKENSIDVSTNATVDIQSLIDNQGDSGESDSQPADFEPDLNEVLSHVNKDIKGNDVLSEAEIAALFAAAGN